MNDRFGAVASGAAGLVAAVTGAVASLCCVGPVVVSIVGVGGAVAAAGLRPYRPALVLGSALLLALGFWLSYRPATLGSAGESGAGRACPTRIGRVTRRLLWGAAAVWATAVLLPLLVNS